MAANIQRDVFKITGSNQDFRFGARLLGIEGVEEKWSGEIPELPELEQEQLIGRIITNSEGEEYLIKKITEENPEGKKNFRQNYFWIEKRKH